MQKQYEYTPIIFVTSIEDPKLYAYSDLHCFYYIEKPYDVTKTEKILIDALRMPKIHNANKSVYFKKSGILIKTEINKIIYIENSRISRIIHTTEGDIKLTYKPCKEIIDELGDNSFVRCNRYTIININYIEYIDKVNRYIKLMKVKEQIELGEIYIKIFEGIIYD